MAESSETLSNLRQRQNRGAVFWFILLTFVGTWSLWSLLWVWNLNVSSRDSRFAQLAYLGTLAPGIAALIVTNRVLRESWRTTTLDRLGIKRFYAWALLLPPAFALVTVFLSVITTAATFDLNPSSLSASSLTLAALTPVIAFFALAEELGWRGFLLPRLMLLGFGEWEALVATGLVWGIWQAPLILRGFNYAEHPYLGVPMMVVFCVLMGVVIGWLRLASSSIWVAAAAHTSVNLSYSLAVPFLHEGFDSALGGEMTSAIGLVSLGAFCVWLARSRRLPVAGAVALKGLVNPD